MSTDAIDPVAEDTAAHPAPEPATTAPEPENETVTQPFKMRGLGLALGGFATSLALAVISGLVWSDSFAQSALVLSVLGVSGMIATLGGLIILIVRDWRHLVSDDRVGLTGIGFFGSILTVLAALILGDAIEDQATKRSQTTLMQTRERILSGEPIDIGEGMRLVAEARIAGKPLDAYDYMETGYSVLRTLFPNELPSRTFVMAIGADRACQLTDAPFSIIGWEDNAVAVDLRGRTPECQGAAVLHVDAKAFIKRLVTHQIARDVLAARNAEARALPDDIALINRLTARRAPAVSKS